MMFPEKPPLRFWIGSMVFFTTFTNYMLRANMSVSVVKMVKREGKDNFTPPCLKKENQPEDTSIPKSDLTLEDAGGEEQFEWSEKQVGHILAAYYYGYLISSIPGGLLADSIGPWHVILWSSLHEALLTALTPLSTKCGFWGVMINRFFIGFFGTLYSSYQVKPSVLIQGVAYPALNVLIEKWAPPSEKSKFLGAMMGNTLGTVFSFATVGAITAQYGWSLAFYFLAVVECLYCLIFSIVVSDAPATHRWISEEEKEYITQEQGEEFAPTIKKVAPVKRILTSRGFHILCIAHFGNLWGLNLIGTYAPKYMAEVLGFGLIRASGLAALPNLARLLSSNFFGVTGDYMLDRNIMSVTQIRKFFTIFSHLLPAACFLGIALNGCRRIIAIILIVASLGFNGAVVVSHLTIPQDLAPNFAGTLYGIMNLLAMTNGIVVPIITGCLNDYYDMGLQAANTIFITGSVAYGCCGLAFLLFGTAKLQPWNEIEF